MTHSEGASKASVRLICLNPTTRLNQSPMRSAFFTFILNKESPRRDFSKLQLHGNLNSQGKSGSDRSTAIARRFHPPEGIEPLHFLLLRSSRARFTMRLIGTRASR